MRKWLGGVALISMAATVQAQSVQTSAVGTKSDTAGHVQTVPGDPWGPLDDLVGRRFTRDQLRPALPNHVHQFDWDVPGQVLREQVVGREEFYLYALDPNGRVVRRPNKPEFGSEQVVEMKNGEMIRSASVAGMKITMKFDNFGQLVEYFVLTDRNTNETVASTWSARYLEEGAEWVGENKLRDPEKWGPLASLANKTGGPADGKFHLRVSDDGEFIEFITLEPNNKALFGLLRADGQGRFRFLQRGFNLMDQIHEGRLTGDTVVLPSLVEPGYQVTIRVYDQALNGELWMHAEAHGSSNQSWLRKVYLTPREVIQTSELAAPLTASAEQRARFDEFFTPAYVQFAAQNARKVLDASVTLEEAIAHNAALTEASDAEFEARIARARSEQASGTGAGNVLQAFVDGFSEATAANDAMEQSMRNAANEGLATGAAEYSRQQARNAREEAERQARLAAAESRRVADSRTPTASSGLIIEDTSRPASSPPAPAPALSSPAQSRPGGAALRGFYGRTCEAALASAVYTTPGSTFEEVEREEHANGDCTVRGYLTNPPGGGGMSRQ